MSISSERHEVCAADGLIERCDLVTASEGPLSGTRLVVKDNIEVDGKRFAAGHPLFSERRASTTAPAVKSLLEAGARLVGMTCTDAGGFGVTTPGVINPIDTARVAGGSTGGGAAALAAGLADLALGTDTAGSVRIPAACTGLHAYKPDFGKVSTAGVWPLAPSFDHVGLLARTRDLLIRGSNALIDGAGAPVNSEAWSSRSTIRVGIERCPPALRENWAGRGLDNAIQQLRTAGYNLVPVDLPDRERLIRVHGTLTLAESCPIYGALAEHDLQRLGIAAISATKAARRLTEEQTTWAKTELSRIRDSFDRVFAAIDVLITPTLSFAPPLLQQSHVDTPSGPIPVLRALIHETCGFNMYGGPAASFPCRGHGAGRIPFSLQAAVGRTSDLDHLGLLDKLMSDLSI